MSQNFVALTPASAFPLAPAGRKNEFTQRQAFAIALLVEAAGIAALVAWFSMHPSRPQSTVVPITIEAIEEKVAEKLMPEPEIPKPMLLPAPPALVQKAVLRPAQVEPPSAPIPVLPQVAAAAPVEAAPLASTPPVFAAPPVIVPAPSVPTGPSPEYIAKVKAAVQAAVVYPSAARALEFRGRTRVEFKLRDAVSSQARVITGSGMALVDRAALQSIQAATFPLPPASMQSREEIFQVWVDFSF